MIVFNRVHGRSKWLQNALLATSQKLEQAGFIKRRVALLDAESLRLWCFPFGTK